MVELRCFCDPSDCIGDVKSNSVTSNKPWPDAFILNKCEVSQSLGDEFRILCPLFIYVGFCILFALNLTSESCHFAGTQLNVCFCCTKLLSATLRITFKPLVCLRLAFLQPVLWMLHSRDCSARHLPLYSRVVFVAISRNSWIASQCGHSCDCGRRVFRVVLVSVHSSSHLFAPFLQIQYPRNTLRNHHPFPFMAVFSDHRMAKIWQAKGQKSAIVCCCLSQAFIF